MKSKTHGFTLIELLVVIAVITVLMGLLVPALGRARAVAREVVCRGNLRQIHTAIQLYADSDRHGRYPLEATEHNPHRALIERLRAHDDDALFRALYCPEAHSMEAGARDPDGGTPLGGVDSVIDTEENRQLGNITYVYWSFERNKAEPSGQTWRDSRVFFPRALTTTGMRPVLNTPEEFRTSRSSPSEIWVLSDFFRQRGIFPHGRRGGATAGGLNIAFLDGHADIVFGRPQDNYK